MHRVIHRRKRRTFHCSVIIDSRAMRLTGGREGGEGGTPPRVYARYSATPFSGEISPLTSLVAPLTAELFLDSARARARTP